MNQPYKIRGTKVTSPYPAKLTPAETRLIFQLQKTFAPEHILADCYFPKTDSNPNNHKIQTRVVSDAELLQIDCITVDQRGIFIYESKDYVGWIYGHGDRVHWTQVSAYGQNKHQFYSPIRQNAAHVAAIASIFGSMVPIYSVIVFGNDATLKVLDHIPKNHYVCTHPTLHATLTNITSVRPPFSETQITDICTKLNASRIAPTTRVRDEHVSEIKSLSKTKPGSTE